ncbi:putative two-component system sensor histidine kinase [Desulfosporosinus metallidurans]|uniref:histidine kinase n=2 Tax=Desulfosporosinus metallidurans TaxID=1888891 RepID=A0A1Q8QQ64_9FIRM|nr:putative two-component system sensor histidine kinase [Desulfosporosinus metallidurans]
MSTLPVLIISSYYLYFARLDLQRSVQIQNNLLVERIAQEVDVMLAHTEESLKNLAVNLSDTNMRDTKGEVMQHQFYRFLHEFPLVDEVVVLDSKGQAITGINRFQIFSPVTNWIDPIELKGLTLEKPYYSPVSFLKSGIPAVKIVVPLGTAYGDSFSGGYGIRLRLRGLLTALKPTDPLSKTDLYVVDALGRLIADSDVTRVLEKMDVRKSYTVEHFLQYRNPQGLPALNQYQSYSGQNVLGGYAVLPRNGWAVMVEQPVAVAFAPINQLFTRFLLFILFILGFVISLSVFYGLSITRPIERLEQAARTVSRGRLDERVPEERQDELGQLARTFNEMMERIQSQSEDLLQEKERLDTIVHGLGAGMALLNDHFGVTWMNPVLERWVNQEILQSMEEITSYLNRSIPQKIYRHQVYPLEYARSNEPCYLMVVEDITERRRMEDLMIQADKLSALGLMASGFAHEINNPLAIIQGYAEDLEEQLESGKGELPKAERIERYLRTIRKHIMRAQHITQSLLNFSRKSEWKVEEMDVIRVIEESLSLMQFIIKKKQIIIVKRWANQLPKVKGDALQLVQVFVNLINNAVDALPEQGEIRIEVESERHSDITVSVRDNGQGIPPELLPKVFDPFFTTKEVGKGTGLGLAISYGIIARLGGAIRVESEPGQGTEVLLTLPVVNSQGRNEE